MKKIVLFFVNPTQIMGLSSNSIGQALLPDGNTCVIYPVDGKEIKLNPTDAEDVSIIITQRTLILIKDDTTQFYSVLTLLSGLIGNEDAELFCVLHKSQGELDNSQYIESLCGTFNEKVKMCIKESEDKDSAYFKFLIPLLISFEKDKFDSLISYFPNPALESLIRIRKSLRVLSVKSPSQMDFKTWKGTIKTGHLPQTEKTLVESLTYDNYESKLDPIEDMIFELQTKK